MKHLICLLIVGCSGDFTSAHYTSSDSTILLDSGVESKSQMDSSKKPNPGLQVDATPEKSPKDVRTTNEASLPTEPDSNVPDKGDSAIHRSITDAGLPETGIRTETDSSTKETSTPVAKCQYCHLNSSHKQLCCSSPVSNICWLDNSVCESWF